MPSSASVANRPFEILDEDIFDLDFLKPGKQLSPTSQAIFDLEVGKVMAFPFPPSSSQNERKKWYTALSQIALRYGGNARWNGDKTGCYVFKLSEDQKRTMAQHGRKRP